MKNAKLKISDLKVKSFITTLETTEVETVKGGLLSIGKHCSHAAENDGCKGAGNDTKPKHTKPLFCGPGSHNGCGPKPGGFGEFK